jgi:glucosamine-6-phosphate deaminase
MEVRVFARKAEMANEAARHAGGSLRDAIARTGYARVIAATGASQLEFLDGLVREPDIDWARTIFFHLDEYIGLPATHPASFRRYLKERIVDRVHPAAFHFIQGDAPDAEEECRRVGTLLAQQPIDVAFVGIGENGHLAFNDPPADFETTRPYLVVHLDAACRRQQLGEGWFARLEEVPERAISMSIPQILLSREIVCVVPDARKAQAVRDCLQGEVSPMHPASALQRHSRTTVFLDADSAALLRPGKKTGGAE